MSWKRDERPENVRAFGDFKVFSEVNSDRETAHVIQFPDGFEMRVLPDWTSGRQRANAVRQALDSLEKLSDRLVGDLDPLVAATYLRGILAGAALEWEEVSPDLEVTIDEWLTHWFANDLPGRGPADFMAECLLGALQDDGWTITRREA